MVSRLFWVVIVRQSMLEIVAPNSSAASDSCTELAIWNPQHRQLDWFKVVTVLMPNKEGYFCALSCQLVVEAGAGSVPISEHVLLDMVRCLSLIGRVSLDIPL